MERVMLERALETAMSAAVKVRSTSSMPMRASAPPALTLPQWTASDWPGSSLISVAGVALTGVCSST